MRRFEFEEGSSKKFWDISVEGADVTTRWGRIGTEGQQKSKTFASAAAAKAEHDKLVKEKVGKGYIELTAAKPKAKAPAAAEKASLMDRLDRWLRESRPDYYATLAPGATQQFSVTVTNCPNTSVNWSATSGTISDAGVYTAPSEPGTYTVEAECRDDTSIQDRVTVTVE